MTKTRPGRFDANDPFDMTAERLRTLVCDAALAVMNTRAYQNLSPETQIEAMLAGITTGMLSVAFSSIEPAGRDEITTFIKSYIDQARTQVEGILPAQGSAQ